MNTLKYPPVTYCLVRHYVTVTYKLIVLAKWQGCHASSQPVDCHKAQNIMPRVATGKTILTSS